MGPRAAVHRHLLFLDDSARCSLLGISVRFRAVHRILDKFSVFFRLKISVMKKYLPRIFTLAALFLSALAPLPAGTKADENPFDKVIKLRSDTASGVAIGDEKPAAAIARLQAHESPSGLQIDHDADVGFALIDVGQRLIAERKPIEAEEFFQAAEKLLEAAVKKTPDTAARDKAMFLQNLGFIRSNYLNKGAQAWADLDSAVKLQPDDKYFKESRDRLAQAPNDSAKDKSKK